MESTKRRTVYWGIGFILAALILALALMPLGAISTFPPVFEA